MLLMSAMEVSKSGDRLLQLRVLKLTASSRQAHETHVQEVGTVLLLYNEIGTDRDHLL